MPSKTASRAQCFATLEGSENTWVPQAPQGHKEDMSDSPSLSGTQPYEQWNTTSAMTAARVAAAPDSMLHPILKHLG